MQKFQFPTDVCQTSLEGFLLGFYWCYLKSDVPSAFPGEMCPALGLLKQLKWAVGFARAQEVWSTARSCIFPSNSKHGWKLFYREVLAVFVAEFCSGRAGSYGGVAPTCAHLHSCLLSKLLQVGSSERLAQAAKCLAESTGSLAEPGAELQSAVFQAFASSHGPSPLLPFSWLTSWQTAAICVQGQLLLQRCLTSILQMFEVPFPSYLCEL